MSADPKELIPSGPSRFRTVTRMPVVVVILVALALVGDLLWNSFHEKKPTKVSPEQTTENMVKESRSESGEPSYLNAGPFSADHHLPHNVPDLSGKKSLPTTVSTDKNIKGKPPVPVSLPAVSRNILSAPPAPASGGGLFVSEVDGGMGSSGLPRISPGGGRAPVETRPVLPGDVALAGSPPSSSASGKPTAYDQTNMQSEKERFLKNSGKKKSSDILENAVVDPVSPFEIQAGSVIHAELVTGINSDLPGEVTAQLTGNLYDSVHERFLLIPQGSRLVGKYDSKVSVGQTRVLMAWERIIFPDGRSIDLSGMEGVDLEGYAGFHDLVDNHYLKIFGNAILMSLVMAGAQMSQPGGGYGMGGMNSFSNPSMGQAAMGSVGQNMSQTMEQYLGNTMNIQPTLKIRPGYRFDITVTRDMVFPGPYLVKGD